ncbi:glycosyl hydrolase family 18 [Phlyctema vagabunda]|uniref:chitinase n=1 Tax=Phlyctema vagabunda TaxID=108571 RepID=A0ABR4PQM9_9HELO
MRFPALVGLLALTEVAMAKPRYIMYLTGQHDVVPEKSLVAEVTHVALAFMRSTTFNEVKPESWPLFTTVEKVRTQFVEDTKIMVAIGGWGDTEGFALAAATEESRELFARNVKDMVDVTGVDIDWEYPGGNGEDYRQIPNSEKAWEIGAYPQLLSSIRSALGPTKLMSAAVPGLPRDMLAFTAGTLPSISNSLDFYNVMTYDLFNRRDNTTRHHTGVEASLQAIDTYLENGVPPEKINLGFAFYVKWYNTATDGGCDENPIGCKTVLMEDPITGGDLGQAAAFSWHDKIPSDLAVSFRKALKGARYDEDGGGTYFWDKEEQIFWSWDDEHAILRKLPLLLEEKSVGGVFAWGLGEDAVEFSHLKTLTRGLLESSVLSHRSDCSGRGRDEL